LSVNMRTAPLFMIVDHEASIKLIAMGWDQPIYCGSLRDHSSLQWANRDRHMMLDIVIDAECDHISQAAKLI
jgi:hypothetical protein